MRKLVLWGLLVVSHAHGVSVSSISQAIAQHSDIVSFGAGYLIATYNQWKRVLSNSKDTPQSSHLTLCEIQSALYVDFHRRALADAGIADADELDVVVARRSLWHMTLLSDHFIPLNQPITSGFIACDQLIDEQLHKIETYCAQQGRDPREVVLSSEGLASLYNQADIPADIQDAAQLLLMHRAHMFFEAGRYNNGDATPAGAARKLAIYSSLFAFAAAKAFVVNSVMPVRADGELRLCTGIVYTCLVAYIADQLYRTSTQPSVDEHAFSRISQVELEQFINFYHAWDQSLTQNLRDALVIARSWNGQLIRDIKTADTAHQLGLTPESLPVAYAWWIAYMYSMQRMALNSVVQIPDEATADDSRIRAFFVGTKIDPRDRCAQAQEVYESRFGSMYNAVGASGELISLLAHGK